MGCSLLMEMVGCILDFDADSSILLSAGEGLTGFLSEFLSTGSLKIKFLSFDLLV